MTKNHKSSKGDIRIHSSIIKRAIENDTEALSTMFKQFIPEDEDIHLVQYLGIKGLWGIGAHSFACLTSRRVADISVGRFSEVVYQDGYLEFINSGIIYQPSKLGLYILAGFWSLLALLVSLGTYAICASNWMLGPGVGFVAAALVLILFIALLPFLIKSYYGIVKCGIVFWVREGVPIYIFSNRKFLRRANLLCRNVTLCREHRLKLIEKRASIP
jgi:hypothetical protein